MLPVAEIFSSIKKDLNSINDKLSEEVDDWEMDDQGQLRSGNDVLEELRHTLEFVMMSRQSKLQSLYNILDKIADELFQHDKDFSDVFGYQVTANINSFFMNSGIRVVKFK